MLTGGGRHKFCMGACSFSHTEGGRIKFLLLRRGAQKVVSCLGGGGGGGLLSFRPAIPPLPVINDCKVPYYYSM